METLAERPVIGVRAIVEGRDSLRTAQSQPVLDLTRQVCRLLEEHVFYADGTPVRCVMSDPVGSSVDAVRTMEAFRRQNVGAVVHVARAWSYPMEILYDDAQIPQLIWGLSGSNAPGTVFMGAQAAAAAQVGVPLFKVYGMDIQDADDVSIPTDVAEKIVLFGQCALAVAQMRRKAYLCVGTTCMGIGAAGPEHDFYRRYLGMRVQSVDMSEVLRRLKEQVYDEAEYAKARRWARSFCLEGEDPNPPQMRRTQEEKERDWDVCVKMALILRDLMDGNPMLAEQGFAEAAQGFDALTASFQGQRHWTDWMPTNDFAESVLNAGFDWNGPRRPHPIATENDALQAAAMLFGALLTGGAQLFCDVRGYWSAAALRARYGDVPSQTPDGFFYLTNSGSMALDGCMGARENGAPAIKPFWNLTDEDVARCQSHVQWHAAKRAVFRGGGFSVSFRAEGGVPLTMVRLNMVHGLGPTLQIVEGCTVNLPDPVADGVTNRTDPTWPQVFFVPRSTDRPASGSVYRMMESWGSNHCVLCPGHVGAAFATLASILRVPVSLHNLPFEQLFRPDLWKQFGADDPIGADFRACAAYGPLYGVK